MRIALCLSGLSRTFEACFDNIKKNIMDNYDVDIFIHTWYEYGYQETTYEDEPNYIEPSKPFSLRNDKINILLNLYKPISFSIDKYHIFQKWYKSNPNYKLLHRYCSMLESIYLANELKKSMNIKIILSTIV